MQLHIKSAVQTIQKSYNFGISWHSGIDIVELNVEIYLN